jgi:hypothetical protein
VYVFVYGYFKFCLVIVMQGGKLLKLFMPAKNVKGKVRPVTGLGALEQE